MAVQDYKINYKSDFVLTINGDAGWATPFCIKFWTGMPSQAYFVGFDGVKYVNCRVGDTPTQLLVMFDNHHLPIGQLKMQIAYHTTIEEFPGSVFDEVTNARDVIVTIDDTDYQVMLDFTGEDTPELEFNLPAYANEAERIQNELQRQQNEAARIEAELQREQATAAAVEGAENVNAQLNGTTLTVTNRNGVSTSVDTKGDQGVPGPVGPEGPQGETGTSIVSFTPKSETTTAIIYTVTFSDGTTQQVSIPKGSKGDTGAIGPQGPQGETGVSIVSFTQTSTTTDSLIYTVTFSDGTTQQVAIPKGPKGDTGEQGPAGPVGPQGVKGDTVIMGGEDSYTLYNTTGSAVNGAMTQQAVTRELTELGPDIYAPTAISDIYIDGSNYRWKKLANLYCRLIPITSGSTYIITAGTGNAQYTFLTSNSYTKGSVVSTWATGYTNQLPYAEPGQSVQVTAPSDAHYLYLLCSTNGTDRNHTVREIISKFDNIDSRLSSIESKFAEADGEAITLISGGFWNLSSGELSEVTGYSYTNAIPVSPGQSIKVSVSVGAGAYGVAGSNTSTFSTSVTPLVGANTQVTDLVVTIPAGINYIFISSRNEDFSPSFSPSAEFLADSWLDIKIANIATKKCQPNVLIGLKLVTLGDSITHGQVMDGTAPENPWPVLVANTFGMELVNYGIGGSTIGTCANYGGTFASIEEFNAATKDTSKYYVVLTGRQTYSDYRYNGSSWVTTTIAMRTPLVDRYDYMDSDADVILVAGGTNDFQYNWAELGTISSTDSKTFYGAMNNLCAGLIAKYPQKCIVFMTPIKRCQTQLASASNSDTTLHRGGDYGSIDSQNAFGKTLKDYGDMIKEVCARYSIPVIDMYAESMLNPQLSSQSSLFDSYKTHPYQAGHNMMARILTGKLREIFGANYT